MFFSAYSWHKYNLKRKIMSLPPFTAEVFAQKVLGEFVVIFFKKKRFVINHNYDSTTSKRKRRGRETRSCLRMYYLQVNNSKHTPLFFENKTIYTEHVVI